MFRITTQAAVPLLYRNPDNGSHERDCQRRRKTNRLGANQLAAEFVASVSTAWTLAKGYALP